jgi:2-methylcitrate dehydratase
MNLAERLAKYAEEVQYEDLKERTVVETKKRVIDSIGCAIGAFKEAPVRIARETVVSTYPGKSSTLLGTRVKTSPDMAAFVNGIMIRYFDYNDTYLSKEPAHPSDNISACMAAGEAARSSGREVVAAVALAYELQCRLCDAADIRHRGWDHVCYGLVSSALASGKLLGLPSARLTHAVNISLNSHIAMRQVRAGELSEWKGASFANAARNAVFSAILAGRGMTGPSPIFEGEMGFFKQVSGPFDLDVEAFGGRSGEFKIDETYLKYFPAEYHAQSAVWAALEARREIEGPEDVDAVEIYTHEAGYTILGRDREKWSPSTKETADHSLPFMVGMALLKGRVDNSTYSPRNFRDPRVLKFLERIKVFEDKGLTDLYPRHIANRVVLRLRNGTTVSKEVDDPKGHPNNPMTNEEVESKFRRLTAKAMSERKASQVLSHLWRLEEEDDISSLLRLCRI